MPKKIETKICSYCGKKYTEQDINDKGILIFKGFYTGEDEDEEPARICSSCVKICQNISEKHINNVKQDKAYVNLDKLTPAKIKAHLDEWVIEQEKPKTDIATEIYNHFKRLKRLSNDPKANEKLRIEKSNMILIGPTGVGKTELVRSLAAYLDLPYTIQDSTSFTASGYNLF